MIDRLTDLLRTYKNPRFWTKNISWRFPSTISSIDVIFVIGAPRSGTTLMQRVLSVHSQLFSIEGETGLFSYQNIFDPKRKHFGLSDFQVGRLFDTSLDIVDFFEKGVKVLMAQNDNKRFVEKTPQHILHLPFILKHFPKSVLIHIVRDGRDCYCSSKSHPHIPQNKSIAVFAKYWSKCVSIPARYKDTNNILTVSYEEFVSEKHKMLATIMEFINLNIEESQLDPFFLGNDKRAKLKEFRSLGKPINPSSIDRWKRELNDNEVCEFERIARRELEVYGYSTGLTSRYS